MNNQLNDSSFYHNRHIVKIDNQKFNGFFWVRQDHFLRFSINFIEYLKKNDSGLNESMILNLKSNLDEESDELINNFLNSQRKIYHNNLIDVNEIFTDIDVLEYNHVDENLQSIFSQYKLFLPTDYLCICVFYYKYGLIEIPNFNEYLKGKSIIDGGAYLGDSAIMFYKEINNVNKIYSFEICDLNYIELLKTIKYNNLESYIIPIKKGIGLNNQKLHVSKSGINASLSNENTNDSGLIEVTSIDTYFTNLNDTIGIIKLDIEGMEYDAILGAKQIIERDKPILLISIYHTGKDFFQIKPLIESRNLGYKFKIRKFKPGSPTLEVILIAYQ